MDQCLYGATWTHPPRFFSTLFYKAPLWGCSGLTPGASLSSSHGAAIARSLARRGTWVPVPARQLEAVRSDAAGTERCWAQSDIVCVADGKPRKNSAAATESSFSARRFFVIWPCFHQVTPYPNEKGFVKTLPLPKSYS